MNKFIRLCLIISTILFLWNVIIFVSVGLSTAVGASERDNQIVNLMVGLSFIDLILVMLTGIFYGHPKTSTGIKVGNILAGLTLLLSLAPTIIFYVVGSREKAAYNQSQQDRKVWIAEHCTKTRSEIRGFFTFSCDDGTSFNQ